MVRIEPMTLESGAENLYHCANLGWIDLQVIKNPYVSRNKLFICLNINFEGERAKKGHVAGLRWIFKKLKIVDKRTHFQHFPTFFKIKINNKTNCFLHENWSWSFRGLFLSNKHQKNNFKYFSWQSFGPSKIWLTLFVCLHT